MSATTRLLLLLSVLLVLPGVASAYDSTQTQYLTGTGQDWTYTYTSLPSASGIVTVTVNVEGDYNSSTSEYADVYIEGVFQERLTDSCGFCGDCDLTGTYTVPASAVADGVLIVEVRNSSQVHVLNTCGCECGTVNVSYTEGTPPTADAGGPYTVGQGGSLSLDGSGSVAGTGSISLYEWDCTNDGTYDTSSSSPTASSCVYPDDGTYTVGLRVTNGVGLTDTDTATVTVTNATPVADAGGPYTVNQGLGLTVDGSGSTDSDGTLSTYEWDCTSDGSYELSSSSPTSTCTYADDGTYTVTLRVTDDDGAQATDSATVTVTNTSPTADAGGPYTVNQGDVLTLDGSGSVDPDGTIVTWAWDCDNDGVYDQFYPSPSGATCSWPDDGAQTVALQITDDDGATATATASVTVTNTPPVAEANGPYVGVNGVPVALTSVGSADADGAIASYAWDCETDGVVDATTPTTSCTYLAPGTFTVTLTVTDDDGTSDSDTATVSIGNDPPTADAGGPYATFEGGTISLDGSGSSDVGNGVVTTWEWDCTDDGVYDVSASSATGSTCAYDDDGTYTVRLRVTDDYGAQDDDTTSVTVTNVAPTVVASGPTAIDEASLASFSAVGTDPSASDEANLGFAWTIAGPGVSLSDTGTSTSFTPDDDGTYTISVTVTDDDGATDTDSITLVVANLPPSIDSYSIPATADEGDTVTFSSTVSDPSSADTAVLVVTYDDGAGISSTADTTAYADDGTYTVTITVEDDDGGSDVVTGTIVVANVDPEITSSPSTTVSEGVAWTYAPTVVDPGDEVFTWSLAPSAPAGMTVDSATGDLSWTPTYAEVLAGPFTVLLTVDDGDGGADTQSFTLQPVAADTDGDGLDDGWELANGLDPNDPNDATADPDGDGLTNLDEFDLGQDPNVYDGPSGLTLVSPIGGVEVDESSPDLVLGNATDPQNEALLYDIEVYEDAALTVLLTSTTDLAEDPSGQTTWKVDIALAENATIWWRARVSDAWVTTPWTAEESFVVNAVNEAPEAPALTAPVAGEPVGTLTPELLWADALDVDGDVLTYDVEVYDASGGLVTSTTAVSGDGLVGSWTVDTDLVEDGEYTWTARAVDEHGLAGPWATEEPFFVTADNAAPTGVAFLEPLDGAVIAVLSPELVASEGVDPEGGALEYEFEVDTVASFDSADYATATLPGTGTGEVVWRLVDDGVVLPENAEVYARVRAIDEGGVTSTPDTISFFVRGDNEAPNVPVLVSPADAEETGASPVLVVEDPIDPEGDLVYVDFVVASDAELVEVLASVEGVLVAGNGTTSWTVDVALEGDVFWSARAIDAFGATSEWAAPVRFSAPTEAVIPSGDDDDDGDGGGCDCNTAGGDGPSALLLLLPLGLLIRRRRGA